MGNAVGVGLHLAGCADHATQPLFFRRSDDHVVQFLHLGGHLDDARLLLNLAHILPASFFFLMAGFLLFDRLSAAAFEAEGTIEKAAQGYGQDYSDNDYILVHCIPPLRSIAAAVSSLINAARLPCKADR